MLLDLLNFTGGLSPGKSQTEGCCLLFGSQWYTKVSLPVTMFQTLSDLPPSNFRSTRRNHSTLPLPFLGQLVGHPTGLTLPYTQVMTQTVSYLFVCLFVCLSSWVFFDQTLHLGHGLVGTNGHRLATTVTVFKRRSAGLKFLVLLANCRSRWRLVPKAVWQTLEALLERLPRTIILTHHCTKISQWCFCTVGKADTLTKHLAV